ncbi:MAG: DUF1700 domain-containing protein [Bacilli bacterium]|nr:DUF1700 domain-containing protein [Bacilli bacterium]
MKSSYLDELRSLLDGYVMDEADKFDIISDYDEMYESWINKGFDHEETVKKLGNPRSIIKELTEGYKRVEKPLPGSEKAIALMPFITLIAFFILGFGYDLWHPGWMVFLLIPITAIIVEMGKTRDAHLTTAISPFFSTVLFLFLGFYYNLWHPAWVVFLIIPILGVWNSRTSMNTLTLITSLSPFVATISFVILGLYGYWIEGWLVFLLIPMIGILHNTNKKEVIIWESLCIFGIAGYLYMGHVNPGDWQFAWTTFIPVIIYSLLISDWNINGDVPYTYRVVSVISILLFLLFGFLGFWEISWYALLIIPMFAIIKEAPKKERIIALSPFIAVIIFFTIGYYFDAWHLSWMAFLIIPMTAIIKNA